MLFGDYLIEKNLIKRGDLLEALCKQLAATPPLLQVLLESGNFSEEELIKIVKLQFRERAELRSILLQKNILSEEEMNKYLKIQNDQRLPLGQVLIEMGKISVDDCASALEEFLAMQHGIKIVDGEIDLSAIDEEEIEAISTEKQSQSMAVVSDPKEEQEFQEYLEKEDTIESIELPLFSFEALEDMVLDEFLEVFDEQKKSEIENSVLEWRRLQLANQDTELKDSFRDLYRELHTLKGTVRFLKAEVSEYIIHNAEDLLSDLIVCAKQIDSVFIEELEDFYLHALDLVWACREDIEAHRSEQYYYEHSENIQNIKKFINRTNENKKRTEEMMSERSLDDIASQF